MMVTRDFLMDMGISEEHIDAILAAHQQDMAAQENTHDDEAQETMQTQEQVSGEMLEQQQMLAELIGQRDALAARVQALEALDAAAIQQAFDMYRAQVEQERANAQKIEAMRHALREAGVQREEFIDLLMEHIDLAQVELEGRSVKDAALIIEPLKALYSGCFATLYTEGAPVYRPLQGNGGMTRADIMAIRDTTKRQQAIAEHHELFGY